MKVIRIPIEKIGADPDNPRKVFYVEDLMALGNNMVAHGQQVPLIVYVCGDGYRLVDGERRWRSAKVVGITDLLAVVHPEKPDDATLAMLQMSVEVHRVSLSPMERSDLLAKIRHQTDMSISDLAVRLQISQPVVTKLNALQRLCAVVRLAVQAGQIDLEKAYTISKEPDPDRQAELLGLSGSMSRDQLRSKLRVRDENEPKCNRAVFALPGGVSIAVHGNDLNLNDVMDRLTELMKEVRRGLSQRLDINTQQKVMKDKAK